MVDRNHWDTTLRSRRIVSAALLTWAALSFIGAVMRVTGFPLAAEYPIGAGAGAASLLILVAWVTERRERRTERRRRRGPQDGSAALLRRRGV